MPHFIRACVSRQKSERIQSRNVHMDSLVSGFLCPLGTPNGDIAVDYHRVCIATDCNRGENSIGSFPKNCARVQYWLMELALS